MICKYCGSRVAENSMFCSQCGRKLGNARVGANPVQDYSHEADYNGMLEMQAIKNQTLLIDGMLKLTGHKGIIDDEVMDEYGWMFF